MDKIYLTINVSLEEHIATIETTNDVSPVELRKKIETACSEHYDANVTVPNLDINRFVDGNFGSVLIKIDSICKDTEKIWIKETWVY
jgi:hypothetical protein